MLGCKYAGSLIAVREFAWKWFSCKWNSEERVDGDDADDDDGTGKLLDEIPQEFSFLADKLPFNSLQISLTLAKLNKRGEHLHHSNLIKLKSSLLS